MTIVVSPIIANRTVIDIIDGALRLLQVKSADVQVSAGEYADALNALNMMVDSWSADSLFIYQVVREQFVINTTNPQTIGPTGLLSTARPTKILQAQFAAAGNNVDFNVEVVGYDDYEAIRLKSLQAVYPQYLYCDYAFPNASIYLYPISTGGTLTLSSEKPLSEFSAISQYIELPPGYSRALKYNLAVDIAPEYQLAAGNDVIGIAKEAKAIIKTRNKRNLTSQVDIGLMNSGQRRYNIYRNG